MVDRVGHNSHRRVGTILAIEAMKHLLCPLLAFPVWSTKLEHSAAAGPRCTTLAFTCIISTEIGGSVDRALAVENQPAIGVCAVCPTLEAVEHFLGPGSGLVFGWTQLEHRPAVQINI